MSREEGLEAPVGPTRLDLAGLCPIGVVAVVLDQPLERLEVGPFLDAVVDTDEATSPPAVGPRTIVWIALPATSPPRTRTSAR